MRWLLLVVVIYLFLVAPSLQKRRFKQTHYAHRGFYAEEGFKENTLPAFAAAIKKGVGIELDVQFSKDKRVVVHHDDDLKRLEKVAGLVCDFSYEELQAYQIPVLTEVLDLVDGQVPLIVELKSTSFQQVPKLCQSVYAILNKYQGTYCIESFNPLIVAWFKRHAPEVMRGQLIQPAKEYPNVALGIFLNSFLYQFMTRPHFIALELATTHFNPALWIARLFGAQFALWTVRTPAEEHKDVDIYIFEKYTPKN